MDYYNDILQLKKFFISNCKEVGSKSINEAYKLWSIWLMSNLNLKNDIVLPNLTDSIPDDKALNILLDKGADEEKSREWYKEFLEKENILYLKYKDRKINVNSGTETETEKVEVEVIFSTYKIILVKSNYKLTLSETLYNKLLAMYKGEEKDFHLNLFEMLYNYDILDGFNFQWSVPNSIFKNMTGELFASPINSHINYYSLFEIDKLFSSNGNLFSNEDLDFPEGYYEVNPPFIESIFEKTIEMLFRILSKNDKVTFLFVMPNWIDSKTYITLDNSIYKKDKYLYKAGYHNYTDIHGKPISSPFDTYVFLLSSSDTFISKNIWFK